MIVASTYPPFDHVSSLRASEFAASLTQRGVDVTVVTSGNAAFEIEQYDGVKVVRIPGVGRNHQEASRPQTRYSNRVLSVASRMIWGAYPEWVQASTKRLAGPGASHPRPDVIWAIHGNSAPHELARRLANAWKVPWVADFKDTPLKRGRVRRRADKLATRRRLRSSAACTAASVCEARSIERHFGLLCHTVYTGITGAKTVPSPQHLDRSPRPLDLVFTGHVSSGRMRPDLLLDGLREMLESGILRLHYFGHDIEGLVSRRDQSLVSDGAIVNHGWVDREQIGGLRSSYDVLVHLPYTSEPQMCVKLLDYLDTDQPILVTPAEQEPVLHRYGPEDGVFTAESSADVSAICEHLLAERRAGSIIRGFDRATDHLAHGLQSDTLMRILTEVASE